MAMFAALILLNYFLFVLINSHNKAKRRSVLKAELPKRAVRNSQPRVSLKAATLLRVTERMRISGSASRFLDLNDCRRQFGSMKPMEQKG